MFMLLPCLPIMGPCPAPGPMLLSTGTFLGGGGGGGGGIFVGDGPA